ncbi:DUF4114 domain-containing protein [Nostoc sp. FACHB-973]|nr:DUF4114 domain-containing protein [Nostoc sp. FACHB-973]
MTSTNNNPKHLPVVSLTSEQTIIPEGEQYTWNFTLSQPAPAEGLTLNVDIFSDTDPAAGDFRFSSASSTNIANFQGIIEDGNAVGYAIQVAAGATEASVVFDIIDDGVIEGEESAIDVLLPGAGYQVDPNAQQVTFTLTDANVSTPPTPSLGAGEVIDLRNNTNDVSAAFVIQGKSLFQNTVGFYEVDDLTGRIGDLTPGDNGYIQAALNRRVSEISNRTSSATVEFDAGSIFAPYLIASGTVNSFLSLNPNNELRQRFTPIAYFGFAEANPDNIDHFRTLGNNTLGAEDLFGGGDLDFNDAVLQINFSSAV